MIVLYILKPNVISDDNKIKVQSDNSNIINLLNFIFNFLNINSILSAILHDFLVYGN